MPTRRPRRRRTNRVPQININKNRRFPTGEEQIQEVRPPGAPLGEIMPKPDSRGKVFPPPGEPVTDPRIYPA